MISEVRETSMSLKGGTFHPSQVLQENLPRDSSDQMYLNSKEWKSWYCTQGHYKYLKWMFRMSLQSSVRCMSLWEFRRDNGLIVSGIKSALVTMHSASLSLALLFSLSLSWISKHHNIASYYSNIFLEF